MSVHEYARREERWYRVHLYDVNAGEPVRTATVNVPVRIKAVNADEAASRVARIFGAAAVRVELVR